MLERNRPYLIPLGEGVSLPGDVRGRTNPKSSTGRIDVFTRVISEGNFRFDEIPAGYEGPLFLEIVSRSFAIRVQEGLTLNQLGSSPATRVAPMPRSSPCTRSRRSSTRTTHRWARPTCGWQTGSS